MSTEPIMQPVQGVCNRYEFAKEILRLAGKEEQLNPVPTSQSDLSSARPAYAVLDNFILRIIEMYMRCLAGRILWKNL